MQKRANIRTTHKGKNNTTDGSGAEAAPISTVVGASAASASPLCVVPFSLRCWHSFVCFPSSVSVCAFLAL